MAALQSHAERHQHESERLRRELESTEQRNAELQRENAELKVQHREACEAATEAIKSVADLRSTARVFKGREGLDIEEHKVRASMSLESPQVASLPANALVLVTGSGLDQRPDGKPVQRLQISEPVVGWITKNNFTEISLEAGGSVSVEAAHELSGGLEAEAETRAEEAEADAGSGAGEGAVLGLEEMEQQEEEEEEEEEQEEEHAEEEMAPPDEPGSMTFTVSLAGVTQQQNYGVRFEDEQQVQDDDDNDAMEDNDDGSGGL